ncbi:protoporphyrinogen oxidase [Streptomyces buecherae]|uniref:protoporphyrinogen oxidase n=1 Tax=Streptomyces buecherae TaxID=2763006 RepID=UPI0037892AFE
MSETHVPAPQVRQVVVIGGGISGLAAAHRLTGGGARVTLLEASGRLGGKLYAGDIAGVPVDLGAESMLARRPEAVELARAVGLGDHLCPPAASAADLYTRGALRPMPTGHLMGVPGDLAPLAASGVLSDAGVARVREDATLPPVALGDDVGIGDYIAARLGREVVDRLVEPLLGGVYAGDAYRISMRAAVPQLYEAARADGSLTEGVRALLRRSAEAAPPGPVFMGIDGGIGRLPLAVADAVRARGGQVRTHAPVRRLARTGTGWNVITDDGTAYPADAVLLALPAPAAARLLAADAPGAAAELSGVEYASVALATMAFRRAEVAALPDSRGFLVPSVDGLTIKASTFSSNKWGWVADADPDLFVLRTSVGRHGDEGDLEREDAELVERSLTDLRTATGLTARPVASRVERWTEGLPQYPVGHLGRVARVREQVAKLPGLRVCGAVYDGVGIPACVASAHAAADELLATTLAAA